MGWTSNWVVFESISPEAVQESLRVVPTGERQLYPAPALAGAVLEDGRYLVVEDSSEEPVGKSFRLAALSAGCSLLAVCTIESVGHSELSEWRAGKCIWRLCSVTEDDSGLGREGVVPSELLEYLAWLVARDGERPDYFNAILELARNLTDYSCGSLVLTDDGPVLFEQLDSPDTAAAYRELPAVIARATAAVGFTPWSAEDGTWNYYRRSTALPGVDLILRTKIQRQADGGTALERSIMLMSTDVARILAELPEEAAGNGTWDDGVYAAVIDSAPSPQSQRLFLVWDSADYERATAWLTDLETGADGQWLAARGNLAGLAGQARTKSPFAADRLIPTVVRRTAMACILGARSDLAAGLIQEYLDQPQLPTRDTSANVVAFDTELRNRFSAYAVARSGNGATART